MFPLTFANEELYKENNKAELRLCSEGRIFIAIISFFLITSIPDVIFRINVKDTTYEKTILFCTIVNCRISNLTRRRYNKYEEMLTITFKAPREYEASISMTRTLGITAEHDQQYDFYARWACVFEKIGARKIYWTIFIDRTDAKE